MSEAVVGVDVAPGELTFDAGGDAVGGAVHGLDLEDVAVAVQTSKLQPTAQ